MVKPHDADALLPARLADGPIVEEGPAVNIVLVESELVAVPGGVTKYRSFQVSWSSSSSNKYRWVLLGYLWLHRTIHKSIKKIQMVQFNGINTAQYTICLALQVLEEFHYLCA